MKHYQHDYYKILGLSKSANHQEIKSAYRKLARTHHPDKTDDDGQMTLINEAYATLKDPKKRADYDVAYAMQFSTTGRLVDKIVQEMSKSSTIKTNLKKAECHAHSLVQFTQHHFDKIAPQLLSRAKILVDKFSHLVSKTPTLAISPTLAKHGGQLIFEYRGRQIRTTLPQGLTKGSQVKLNIDGQVVWFVISIEKSSP